MRWQKSDFWLRSHERSHMDIMVPLVARLLSRSFKGKEAEVVTQSEGGTWGWSRLTN